MITGYAKSFQDYRVKLFRESRGHKIHRTQRSKTIFQINEKITHTAQPRTIKVQKNLPIRGAGVSKSSGLIGETPSWIKVHFYPLVHTASKRSMSSYENVKWVVKPVCAFVNSNIPTGTCKFSKFSFNRNVTIHHIVLEQSGLSVRIIYCSETYSISSFCQFIRLNSMCHVFAI